MPKNENNEITCINHPNVILTEQKELAVMPAYEKNEALGTYLPKGTGYSFDVYICEECEYTELYARNQIDQE